jgi:hypothetical protein
VMDPEHIENNGFPMKDFWNERIKNRVYTLTLNIAEWSPGILDTSI